LGARSRGPPPAPRACAAPTQSHARIVVVYPIECDHIYVNRVISHEVIVSEFITLQTLHRRFRPGTPSVGLILKTYSRQKRRWNEILYCLTKCGFYIMDPEVSKDFCMTGEKITTSDEWVVEINDELVCQKLEYENPDL